MGIYITYLQSHVQYKSWLPQAPHILLCFHPTCAKLVLIFSGCECSWCLVKAQREPEAIYIHIKAGAPFTGRGKRAWIRGSPVCRAASRSCRGRRWACLSEHPAHSCWTPPWTGGPRCWTDTPGWKRRLLCCLRFLMESITNSNQPSLP